LVSFRVEEFIISAVSPVFEPGSIPAAPQQKVLVKATEMLIGAVA
jgi:hypothetical protein